MLTNCNQNTEQAAFQLVQQQQQPNQNIVAHLKVNSFKTQNKPTGRESCATFRWNFAGPTLRMSYGTGEI